MQNYTNYKSFGDVANEDITVAIAETLSQMLQDGFGMLEACRGLAILCKNREYSRAFENIAGLLLVNEHTLSFANAFAEQNKARKQMFPPEFLRCLDPKNPIEFLSKRTGSGGEHIGSETSDFIRRTEQPTISFLLDAFAIKRNAAKSIAEVRENSQ